MTSVVISQPMYFPWPGFFELLASADVFIHLDDVQFSRGSFTNRIQVKHPAARRWMTIPLVGKGAFQTIRDLRAAGEEWRAVHRSLLEQSLREAPHLDGALRVFTCATEAADLARVLMDSIEGPADALGIVHERRLLASEIGVAGSSWRRVLDLVLAVGGTRYVTAHGAANYLDHAAFEREGVSVEYIDYSLTPWRQFHGAFTPYVTVLDLLAHHGPDARTFIRSNTVPWAAHLERRTSR